MRSNPAEFENRDALDVREQTGPHLFDCQGREYRSRGKCNHDPEHVAEPSRRLPFARETIGAKQPVSLARAGSIKWARSRRSLPKSALLSYDDAQGRAYPFYTCRAFESHDCSIEVVLCQNLSNATATQATKRVIPESTAIGIIFWRTLHRAIMLSNFTRTRTFSIARSVASPPPPWRTRGTHPCPDR
jgi:hypothetical protein